MPVFSTATWAMSAVQLVSSTSSQLATLNSLQAMFTASTYWEQETTGTSTAGYKYFVVRPKVALNSIYKDYRIFFCERVNYAVGRTVSDSTAAFNTATQVMSYFCPDGGALTFTPANIETGLLWPGTNYKSTISASSGNTFWTSTTLACTALWMYECEGALWIVSRQSSTSHSLTALGNILQPANPNVTDYGSTSPTTEIGLAGFYSARGLTNSSITPAILFAGSPRSMACWIKPSGVAARTTIVAGGSVSTPYAAASTTAGTGTYETTYGTAAFIPTIVYAINNVAAGAWCVRGIYWTGTFKTRTTIMKGGIACGFTWYPDDTANQMCMAFMNT